MLKISLLTGRNLFEIWARKMENVELSDLGYAHRVVANKDNCTIRREGDKKKINRVSRLKIKLNT